MIDDPTNAAPEFTEGATAVRYVEENATTGDTIGRVLMVDDDDSSSFDLHPEWYGCGLTSTWEVRARWQRRSD